jgi:hypothetical protein
MFDSNVVSFELSNMLTVCFFLFPKQNGHTDYISGLLIYFHKTCISSLQFEYIEVVSCL